MNKLLVITGPTAVGKTELAVRIANILGGEIISADSRQVYKKMDIGTAKPGLPLQKKIPHHLLDIVNPDESFSLADYQSKAYVSIDNVTSKGKKPILVGGTGLYIQAVVDGLKIPKIPPNDNLRLELEGLNTADLVARLSLVDPDSVKSIPPTNKRRLIRALEVTELSGQPFSVLGRAYHRRYDTLQIGLTAPREVLYERADERVNRWIHEGWEEEVKKLRLTYPETLPSMSSLGYRQMGMYLDGKITLSEALQRTKFDIHRFIRRQVTWFRRDGRIFWYDTTEDGYLADLENRILSWYADGT